MAEPIAVNSNKHRLQSKNFGVASFKFNRWSAELEESQTLDDALRPEFWAEQSSVLMGHDPAKPSGRGDIIEIRQLNTGLFVELIVREIGKGYVKCEVLRRQEPEAVAVPDSSPLGTKWNPGTKTFAVIRKDNGAVMSSGHQTKPAALEWIANHLKAMAA